MLPTAPTSVLALHQPWGLSETLKRGDTKMGEVLGPSPPGMHREPFTEDTWVLGPCKGWLIAQEAPRQAPKIWPHPGFYTQGTSPGSRPPTAGKPPSRPSERRGSIRHRQARPGCSSPSAGALAGDSGCSRKEARDARGSSRPVPRLQAELSFPRPSDNTARAAVIQAPAASDHIEASLGTGRQGEVQAPRGGPVSLHLWP